ncbi:MAG: hypothetical protein KKG47_00090 [Proteobacteria bacterium]|nr:hypothetical protein [Pseudomonadota bacterium]MBU1738494.1 hypothetical protein [Pseudomonadota bacterium]
MKIDERARDRVRKSLEHELGREVTEEEVAASYRRINLYLAAIDLNPPKERHMLSGFETLTGWFK